MLSTRIALIAGIGLSLYACQQTPEKVETQPMATSHEDWSKKATIYEVNIRQFSPEGTFKAFQKDLRRLQGMGVKILWLMPIQPISVENRKGSLGSYYAIQDYKGINPEFGTLEDFKSLVDSAHALGMKVILDWVANHTGFDNVWTKEHKDWYLLDSLGKLQPPTGTDWWDVADLNYENAEMRAAMIEAMQYWVKDNKVDGFRCDVAGMVPIDFWDACRDSLERIRPDIFMLAEANNPELLVKAFDMDYCWDLLHAMNSIAKGEMNANDIDSVRLHMDKKYAPNAYHMYFTTNHDENSWNGTVFKRYGEKGHRTFAVLALTLDGMPLIYNGQEAGLDYALRFFDKDTIRWKDYPHQEFYSKLLRLHADNEALWAGNSENKAKRLTSDADTEVYAFIRSANGHDVVVVCNLSDKYIRTKFQSFPQGEFTGLYDTLQVNDIANFGLEMEPYGFHVFYR